MKNLITEQIRKIIEIYKDPEDMIPIIELKDIDGNDSFWYL
jgi:hypothetical protein